MRSNRLGAMNEFIAACFKLQEYQAVSARAAPIDSSSQTALRIGLRAQKECLSRLCVTETPNLNFVTVTIRTKTGQEHLRKVDEWPRSFHPVRLLPKTVQD